MELAFLKQKIQTHGTAILQEEAFNHVFPGPSQWDQVRNFCQENLTSFEYVKESSPRLYLFRKVYFKRQAWKYEATSSTEFRFRRFSHKLQARA